MKTLFKSFKDKLTEYDDDADDDDTEENKKSKSNLDQLDWHLLKLNDKQIYFFQIKYYKFCFLSLFNLLLLIALFIRSNFCTPNSNANLK